MLTYTIEIRIKLKILKFCLSWFPMTLKETQVTHWKLEISYSRIFLNHLTNLLGQPQILYILEVTNRRSYSPTITSWILKKKKKKTIEGTNTEAVSEYTRRLDRRGDHQSERSRLHRRPRVQTQVRPLSVGISSNNSRDRSLHPAYGRIRCGF